MQYDFELQTMNLRKAARFICLQLPNGSSCRLCQKAGKNVLCAAGF